jgi:hypothetical protein
MLQIEQVAGYVHLFLCWFIKQRVEELLCVILEVVILREEKLFKITRTRKCLDLSVVSMSQLEEMTE